MQFDTSYATADINIKKKYKRMKQSINLIYVPFLHEANFRGRRFESEGGRCGTFFEITILTLKMLEINNLSSSGKKINTLTLTC